jgi:hypothetical protein
MAINRTLTLTALVVAGGLVMSLTPSADAEAQPRRRGAENAQTCSQNGKSCKRARARRIKRGNEYRRPRRIGPDFWETQRQNQRG